MFKEAAVTSLLLLGFLLYSPLIIAVTLYALADSAYDRWYGYDDCDICHRPHTPTSNPPVCWRCKRMTEVE